MNGLEDRLYLRWLFTSFGATLLVVAIGLSFTYFGLGMGDESGFIALLLDYIMYVTLPSLIWLSTTILVWVFIAKEVSILERSPVLRFPAMCVLFIVIIGLLGFVMYFVIGNPGERSFSYIVGQFITGADAWLPLILVGCIGLIAPRILSKRLRGPLPLARLGKDVG